MDLDMSWLDTSSSAVALRHEVPPPKRLRLSEVNANDDQAVPEWDCSAPYEQWLDYSAYESRYKSPSLHSSSQDKWRRATRTRFRMTTATMTKLWSLEKVLLPCRLSSTPVRIIEFTLFLSTLC
jgi:hypothetical protein